MNLVDDWQESLRNKVGKWKTPNLEHKKEKCNCTHKHNIYHFMKIEHRQKEGIRLFDRTECLLDKPIGTPV